MITPVKNIYCISGLGADEKAFARINIPGYKLLHLTWIMPQKNEPISQYAARMAACINDEAPILMGLSFGGMMCIEIAKHKPGARLILLSSIQHRRQIPLWMRACGRLKLNQLIPIYSYSFLEPVQNKFIGVSTPAEKEMVRAYRKNVSIPYLRWAIHQVLNWQNNWQPPIIHHIHGDADKIFPIKNVQPDCVIKGGGHLMIMNKAVEVNQLLQQLLLSN
ncbi:MAG: hypothetical protein RL172_2818 [Bacteroidota bacterium]